MSRQSKAARLAIIAKQFSIARQKGEKGPSKTTPTHGKRWTYRNNPEIAKRIGEATKAQSLRANKTSGKQILENAGSAADSRS